MCIRDSFTTAGGVATSYIARWNGAGWSPMGAGADSFVFALARLANGDLVAAGGFQAMGGVAANRIARWSPAGGGTWSALGAGMNRDVRTLAELPGGDLIAGGAFTTAGGGPANYVARWSRGFWSGVGAGVDTFVRTLTVLPGGDFVAAGHFVNAGGRPVMHLARACGGPTWTAFGSGCGGGGSGTPTLTLVSPPQLGRTFGLAAQNLGNGAAVMVLGLTPQSLPLQPFGFGFNCTLLATPDVVEALVTSGGVGTWSLAVPNVPALAGLHLWNQVLVFGAWPGVSNGGDGEIR